MIRASHHPFWTSFMRFFTFVKMRLHFRDVMIDAPDAVPGQQAVLLIGNHYSWWDGFAGNYLNIKYFNKKFHVMMLEEELRQRRFLSKAGAYSIQPSSRQVFESLHYTNELLKDNTNLILLFPQGLIQSVYQHPLRFASGWYKVLDSQMMPSIFFMVTLPEYGSYAKPTLYIYVKQYHPLENSGPADVEKEYNLFLAQCISKSRLA